MRLSSLVIPLAAFVLAAIVSIFAAQATVAVVEDRSVDAVQEALQDAGHNWATVLGDGLQVILEGEAASEAVRFRAISISGSMVDASRVIDNMKVVDSAGIAPPDFSVEILRNDSGVSLIGLIPAASDREAIAKRISDIAGEDLPVTDLLESANYPVPDGWDPAMNFALRALAQLPRSKISVSAGVVEITAISESAEQKARIETELRRTVPGEVRMDLDVTAPRPVISPFTVRFILEDGEAQFDACAVSADVGERKIIAAAREAGLTGPASCTLALGAPSRTWPDAVARSIAAVGELGGGTVTLSDTDITLVAPQGTVQGLFDRIVGELENDLPDVFALEAILPATPDAAGVGPPQFIATRSPEGNVQLRGRVSDETLNSIVENYARARFPGTHIDMGTRIVDGMPANWSVRVLAGIEALSMLTNGSVIVEPDSLVVRGNTGNEGASAAISRLLIDKLGQSEKFEIDVEYVKQLDPIAGLPTPEECIDQITILSSERKITFEPGSATIDAAAQSLVDDIAEVLKICADLRLEIAGYTDSQGREEMNQQLSQQRAEAVLAALRMRRVPTGSFTAVGNGEADPIADNDTEAGREANRRIEFHLIEPEPIEEQPTALEEAEAGAPEDTAQQPVAPTEVDPVPHEATVEHAETGTTDEQN